MQCYAQNVFLQSTLPIKSAIRVQFNATDFTDVNTKIKSHYMNHLDHTEQYCCKNYKG